VFPFNFWSETYREEYRLLGCGVVWVYYKPTIWRKLFSFVFRVEEITQVKKSVRWLLTYFFSVFFYLVDGNLFSLQTSARVPKVFISPLSLHARKVLHLTDVAMALEEGCRRQRVCTGNWWVSCGVCANCVFSSCWVRLPTARQGRYPVRLLRLLHLEGHMSFPLYASKCASVVIKAGKVMIGMNNAWIFRYVCLFITCPCSYLRFCRTHLVRVRFSRISYVTQAVLLTCNFFAPNESLAQMSYVSVLPPIVVIIIVKKLNFPLTDRGSL
jgi:hypothetical protein